MKEENVITVNYAYEQDGVIVYPDLIKVKMALDNGEVLGIETTGYLNSHTERELVKDATGRYTNRYARFNHILEVDRRLLVFPDKRVPKYILQQDYYALNNIDITNSKILEKGK